MLYKRKTNSRFLTKKTLIAKFSLIELFIVIGIIAVLFVLLLSSMSKIKERAEQTACQSNLRQWGVGANLFAADQNGLYPLRCWSFKTNPGYCNELQGHDINWWTYGTPMSYFIKYGISPEVMKCPGSDYQAQADAYGWGTQRVYKGFRYIYGSGCWKMRILIGYCWYGGLSSAAGKYARLQPLPGNVAATTLTNSIPSSVLASDTVKLSYSDRYIVNHSTESNQSNPPYQGVLHADGSVTVLRNAYTTPLCAYTEGTDYSYSITGPYPHAVWWEGSPKKNLK